MPEARRSPRTLLVRGIATGLAGTAAMTAWQELSARLQQGGEEDGSNAEPEDPWKEAPVPAQVAASALEQLTGNRPPPERIPFFTHVMHWAYGTTLGVVYALMHRRPGGPGAGLRFGAAAWAGSYLQLVPLGFYEPPWRYPPRELALDLSYHLAYGLGAAGGHRALTRV